MTQTNTPQANQKKKIKLPEWVYRNIDEYGNCALPNECLEMDADLLVAHLREKSGRPITLRKCEFIDSDLKTYKREKISEYLIAEDRR